MHNSDSTLAGSGRSGAGAYTAKPENEVAPMRLFED